MSRAARRFQFATTIPGQQYNTPTALAVWGSSSAKGDGGGGTSLNSELPLRFGVPCYNGGYGGQWSTHTAARQGGRQAQITVSGGSIPASGPVNMTTPTMNLRTFTAAGTLQGVSGTLATSGDVSTYLFTRSGTGSAVSAPAGTPFIPTEGISRRASGTIIWAGKNDITTGGDMTVCAQTIQAMIDYLLPGTRYLVMGHFADVSLTVGTGNRTRLDAENARLASTYGGLYVNVFAYLKSSQVWIDAGITPTSTDLSDQAAGIIPSSLRFDTGHLNSTGYIAVSKMVGDIIEAQGWF